MIDKSAQSFASYAFLVLVVGAALLAMNTLVKRAIQAKIRDVFVASGYSNQTVRKIKEESINLDLNVNSVANVSASSTEWVDIEDGKMKFYSKSEYRERYEENG